jgi:cysteinyl-tRNA synthetase
MIVLCSACGGGGGGSDTTGVTEEGVAQQAKQPSLSNVTFWAYQIQGLENPGAVDLLAASHYDMLVLEPTRTDWSSENREFDTRGMVERLKATLGRDGTRRKLVIAYVDIGEAEDWRWYWTWSKSWPADTPRPADWPDFIVTHDPDGWEGNYPVAYWRDAWKDIMIYGRSQSSAPYGNYHSALDEVIRDGFDGIYLDWVEGYQDEQIIRAAQSGGVDAAQEMVSFIAEMRAYARSRNPNFLVIQQNAAALAKEVPLLLTYVDAIAQEGIWFDGNAAEDWDDPDGYDDGTDAALTRDYLNDLSRYLAAGLPVFNCEYALVRANDAYQFSLEQGYIPYSTRRSLGKLTTTPPPGY